MHLHLVLEVSQEKRAHPGTFLQWNGGRSTVNGGHLLAFNVARLHRGPAIVRRRTKTVPGRSPWSDKDSDTSDMTLPEVTSISAVSLFHSSRSFWKDTWRLVLGCSSEKSLRNDSYRVVPLWSVYVAVLVTSKTTILRFQMNERKLKGSSWWTGRL